MDHYLVLGLLGGLLALDDRAGWQSLVSQPAFSSTLVGFLLGELVIGLLVGMFLEMIWLAILPMRGTRRPDQVCGAITGAASACYVVQGGGDPRFAFIISMGVLLGLVVGELAARISFPLMSLRERRLGRVVKMTGEADWQPASSLLWIQIFAMSYIFVVEVLLVLLFVFIGSNVAIWVSSHAGYIVTRAFEQWGLILPAFGVASLIHVFWHKHLTRFLVMSTGIILIVLWISHPTK
jgi:mannose/fructose/N-acetylgalactosamine-specific phosphotransferase system component IIC